jgi:hypothetical protein
MCAVRARWPATHLLPCHDQLRVALASSLWQRLPADAIAGRVRLVQAEVIAMTRPASPGRPSTLERSRHADVNCNRKIAGWSRTIAWLKPDGPRRAARARWCASPTSTWRCTCDSPRNWTTSASATSSWTPWPSCTGGMGCKRLGRSCRAAAEASSRWSTRRRDLSQYRAGGGDATRTPTGRICGRPADANRHARPLEPEREGDSPLAAFPN